MKNILYLLLCLIFIFNGCDSNSPETAIELFEWSESTPEAEGMNSSLLTSGFTIAENSGFIDGMLIIKNGRIVKEAYYNRYHEPDDHNVKSVSKSFLSAITGIAVQEGYLTLEDKVLDYFPEYIYDGIDERKYDLTVKHLLTMHMGIRSESDNNYQVYMDIYNSNNWLKTTIEYPLLSAPGERMRYNTFQTHLLSAIVQKAVGRSILDYAKEKLFNPMGITIGAWENQNGYYFGGNSMHFSLRELGVFGLLYFNEGRLNGEQIVPETWVHESTRPFTNWSTTIQWGEFHNYNYGYLWWMGKINNEDCLMALGYGGQMILIFKTHNLIFVSLSYEEAYPETAGEQELAVLRIVSQYILPADM